MNSERTDIQLAERISRLIYRKLLGILTPEEERELAAWRDENPRHERLYRKLLDTTFLEMEYRKRQIADAGRPLADMQRRLRQMSVRRRLWPRLGGAAAIVLLLATSVVLLKEQTRQEELLPTMTEQEATAYYAAQIRPGETEATLTLENGEAVRLGADTVENRAAIQESKMKQPSVKKEQNLLSTARGGEFRVTLEDGTEVWLNAETQLIYPDTFAADERRVELRGEAYFKVAKNEAKPFYVESRGQLVRVYGTEFNIRAYEEDADVYTTLVEGSISQRPLHGSGAELVLTPGKQAVFDKEREETSVRPVDTQSVTAWRKGMFVFEEQNLEQIMQDLSRWYDFSYEFKDEALRKTVFMGTVPRYGDFREVLEILEKSGGLKFSMRERMVIVSAR